MAKRFTDTEKWKKPFIRGLQGPYKLLWLYICDDCDHAGIWQVDIDVAQIRIGEKINLKDAISSFEDKIIVFDNGNKWFIPSFIEFQYPSGLNPENRSHNSVIILLDKYNLRKKNKPLISPSEGRKDMDMVKVMDMDMVKDKVKEAKINFLWDGDDVVKMWDEWKEYKSQHFKFKYKTIQSEQAAFDSLVELSESNFLIAKEIVKQSMANGWKGFFSVKTNVVPNIQQKRSSLYENQDFINYSKRMEELKK
jgi:hypothetical protein